jgi:hypothetical protein
MKESNLHHSCIKNLSENDDSVCYYCSVLKKNASQGLYSAIAFCAFRREGRAEEKTTERNSAFVATVIVIICEKNKWPTAGFN